MERSYVGTSCHRDKINRADHSILLLLKSLSKYAVEDGVWTYLSTIKVEHNPSNVNLSIDKHHPALITVHDSQESVDSRYQRNCLVSLFFSKSLKQHATIESIENIYHLLSQIHSPDSPSFSKCPIKNIAIKNWYSYPNIH